MNEKYIINVIQNALKWYAQECQEHLDELKAIGREHTFDYAVDKETMDDIHSMVEMVADGRIRIVVQEGGESGQSNT